MDSYRPKKLFWSTLIGFLLIMVLFPIAYKESIPAGIEINTRGQPTIGYPRAPVHVVVFEEPKCSECKQFTNLVYPKIKKKFIDTNKIRYTVIPVSFLPNSLPAAIALLGVYYSDPQFPNDDLYFKFFDYIYANQPEENSDWATPEKLVEMAKNTSPAIDLEQLHHCIVTQKYRIPVEKNTLYAQEIMGGRVSTPTVYVNGIKVQDLSIDGISKLINLVLKRNGGH